MIVWIRLCREKFTLVSLNERLLIVGDGIKVSKESQRQPGLKYLHSPSQNQSKPQAQLHEGVDDLREQQHENAQQQSSETAVSRMMSLITFVAINQGQPMYAALDALFSTKVAFHSVFNRLQEDGSPWVHLITRAKSNYVGFTAASRRKKERVKLWDASITPKSQRKIIPTRFILGR